MGKLTGRYFIIGIIPSKGPLRVLKFGDTKVDEEGKERYEAFYLDNNTQKDFFVSHMELITRDSSEREWKYHEKTRGYRQFVLEIKEGDVPQALIDVKNKKYG